MWNNYDEKWIKIYANVNSFVNENDEIYPSTHSKNEDEAQWGRWCNTQRRAKNNGTISDERVRLLEKLKGWKWDVKKDTWIINYNKVKQFIAENGRYPSLSSKNNEEKQLATWCHGQRKSKKYDKLFEENIKLLEDLEGWAWEGLFSM